MDYCNCCTKQKVYHLIDDPLQGWCAECGKCRVAQCDNVIQYRVEHTVGCRAIQVHLDVCAQHIDWKLDHSTHKTVTAFVQID